MLPIELVAYLILFILVGVLFLFVSLLIGRFIRPRVPSAAKGEAYECGEPAVGSSYIQFDLRFYVVALLFIIFEVELAFFFPPAVVFGKLNQLRSMVVFQETTAESPAQLTPAAKAKFEELSIPAASVKQTPKDEADRSKENNPEQQIQSKLTSLSLMTMLDMAVFFVVLLVGFAFLWKQGDLNWVRAVGRPTDESAGRLAGQGNVKLAVLQQTGEER